MPWLYTPLVVGTGLLYTIPSLALFVLMPLFLGTRILDTVNVVVAMTIYTVALLTRTVADALAAVDESVSSSATAMGFGALRRLLTVELPLAVPVIAAGMRVAAVSNVSIVSVAALIGSPSWARCSPTASSATSSTRSSPASSPASCWRCSSTS